MTSLEPRQPSIPQTYGICGQRGGWWSNNSWSAENGQDAYALDENQQIAPAGFELQDEGYKPPNAFVEEVLDEE